MLRRLFKNRPPDPPKGQRRGADPASPSSPPAEPPPQSAAEALLALPADQAAARVRACDDVDELIELALDARGELRDQILAHPQLAVATALTALEKRSRNRNKTLNRHARRLLDRRRTLQHEAAATEERATELASALERRGSTGEDRAWRERQHELYRRLEETLNGYAQARAALAAFGDTVADLEPLRVDPTTLPALESPPVAAAAAAAPEATDKPSDTATAASAPGPGPSEPSIAEPEPFEPLVEAFLALDADMRSGAPFDALAERRQDLTERWLIAADHRPPEPAQHEVFEAVSHRFRELADGMARLSEVASVAAPKPLAWPADDQPATSVLWSEVAARRRLLRELEKSLQPVSWPDWAPPTSRLTELRDVATALRSQLAEAEQRQREELTTLATQLDALTTALDEGSLGTARNLLSQARARHDALPADATGQLGRELGRQAARLAELKDWQTFATTPKREALLEAMTALAESPLAPPEQADRIKALRQQWRELGPVTQAADGRLADRFNAEAEKAFATCRAYFAELAEQRKANLVAREALCDQLQRYLEETDWRRADMKAAEQIMRAARDEWRRLAPVDRGPGKVVEARFEGLQGQLHDRVKAEWDRNLQAKEALVAEAEALADGDAPVQEKVDGAIALQRRWREVGVTPRRPDQRLWRAFRRACDRIFSAREEARHAADAAVEALEASLGQALDAFQARLEALQADAGAAGEAELRDFRNRTATVERLPASRRRALSERREALERGYRRLLKERQLRLAARRLEAARLWDIAAAEAETAGSAMPDPADPDAVSGEVLEARRAAADGAVPSADLHRLTIRAELAAGLPSPAEDKPLRMEVQVGRLQAGLSGAGADPGAADLVGDWCRLGPKDASIEPLRERFFSALTALQKP